MRFVKLLCLMTIAATVSACGTTDGDRGLSGAGIGAGVGALAGPPGVVVGGLVGAGVGMATEPQTVNLGEPVWN